MKRLAVVVLVVAFSTALIPAAPDPVLPKVGPVPKAVRDGWKLDAYYTKYADASGVPVVASKNVDDKALAVAADIIKKMLSGRPDLLKALATARVRIGIIGKDEQTTDLPEYVNLRPKAEMWNTRTRGLGATPAALACSVGEENLLGLAGDRYKGESILIHEFGHTFHTMALNTVDPKFEPRLKELYAKAIKKGLWEKTYAATDYLEYWAEGVQSYFDANMPVKQPDGIHNTIATRDALKTYDPDLYNLIDTTLKSPKWKWTAPIAPNKP